MSTASVVKPVHSTEDPLLYLPCAPILEFKRGQTLYAPGRPADGLYLLIVGKIKVCHVAEDGHELVTDVYVHDELFGESALLESSDGQEVAVTLETAKVMKWTSIDLQEKMVKQPKLAVALTQLFAQRSVNLVQRMHKLTGGTTRRRVASTLISFADRFGERADDGSEHVIFPFTHQLLADYVGTSRELISQNMNQFRRQGCLRYSRRGFVIYREAMKAALDTEEGGLCLIADGLAVAQADRRV